MRKVKLKDLSLLNSEIMRNNRKKRKKGQKSIIELRDKIAERIVYVFLILLMMLGIAMGYKMSQEFTEMELQDNGHFKKIETEK